MKEKWPYKDVIIVTDRDGRIVASKVLEASRYSSIDRYDRAFARVIGRFERAYPPSKFTIYQGMGTASLDSFLSVYPEVGRPIS